MNYRRLGVSGPLVSLAGLGCNNFGGRADFDATRRVVHRALDLGITFFDTADSYGYRSASEEFLGAILGGRRGDIVLATKFGNIIKGSGSNERPLASREYVIAALESSLRRLKTDCIDLYQIHHPDPRVPLEETLNVLNDLVRQGKIRHIGCSNFSASEVEVARRISQQNNWASIISCQNGFNMLRREAQRELLPTVEKYGMAFLPYAPLAGGLLSGKYRTGVPLPAGARLSGSKRGSFKYLNDANLRIVESLLKFSAARDQSLLALAFGWLAAHPGVSSVMAGAMTALQVEQNVAAAEWIPTRAEMREIDVILDS